MILHGMIVFYTGKVILLQSVHLTSIPGITSTSLYPVTDWLLSNMVQMLRKTEPVLAQCLSIITQKVSQSSGVQTSDPQKMSLKHITN